MLPFVLGELTNGIQTGTLKKPVVCNFIRR